MAGRRTAKQQVQMQAPEPMEEVSRKRPWEKVDADGKVIKRKKVPGAKNIRIRKHVQPRNALSCLNELAPGVVFNTEQEGGVGQQYGVSLTIEDNTYSGYGPSKQIAKQNAAEAALVSFVKPPVPKAGPGEENEKMEDKTPWAALAAFAMYKLFNDWKEGRIGTQGQAGGAGLPTNPSFDLRNHLTRKTNATAPSAEMNDAITAHLGTPAAAGAKVAEVGKGNAPGVMKPAAKVPDNAASVHPVMVLHQMRPGIQYTTNKTTGDDNMPYFYASVNIDGQEFTGEGSSLKKAKFFLARDAIYALFGVESVFENPA